jgi:cell division transport system permease protein
MHLIGAPGAYVRGPFIIEGILQGGAGAILAIFMLGILFLALGGAYLRPLADALHVSGIQFLSVGLSILLFLGGMLVGCLGGVIASRRS